MNDRKSGQHLSSFIRHNFAGLLLCLIFLSCGATASLGQSLRWVVTIPDTSAYSRGISLTEMSNGYIAVAAWFDSQLNGKLVILRSDGSLVLNHPYPDRHFTVKDSVEGQSAMVPVTIQEQAPGVIRCVAITGYEIPLIIVGGSFYIFTMDTLGQVRWENDDFRRSPTITNRPWVYLQMGASVDRSFDGGYITAMGTNSGNGRDIEFTILDSNGRFKSTFAFPPLGNYYLSTSSLHTTQDGGCLITSDYIADDSNNTHGGYPYPIGVPYLLRLDRNGAKLWDKLILRDTARFVQNGYQTPDNGVVIQGRYYTIDTASKLFYERGTLTKYGSDTELRWEKTFTVTGRTETFPMAFKPTSDNGYVVCGYSGMMNQSSRRVITSTIDAFVMKFDRDGNKQWEYELPDSLYPGAIPNIGNVPFDIIETQNGEYIITGGIGGTGSKAFVARIFGPRSGVVPGSDDTRRISGTVTVSPNPTTSECEIRYHCTIRSRIRITIMNSLGQSVLIRDCGEQEPGVRRMRISTGDLRAGGVFCEGGGGQRTYCHGVVYCSAVAIRAYRSPPAAAAQFPEGQLPRRRGWTEQDFIRITDRRAPPPAARMDLWKNLPGRVAV